MSKEQRIQNTNILLALLITASLSSCVKKIDEYQPVNTTNNNQPVTDILQLNAPASFRYSSERNTDLSMQLLSNNNEPLSQIAVRILTDAPENGGSLL